MAEIKNTANWAFETKQLHIGQEQADPVTDSRAASYFFSHARAFSIDIRSQSPFSSEGIASIMLSHRRRR